MSEWARICLLKADAQTAVHLEKIAAEGAIWVSSQGREHAKMGAGPFLIQCDAFHENKS